MTARLLRSVILALGMCSVIWFAWFVLQGKPGWALSGALFLLFSPAVVLAIEFAWMALANRADPAPALSLGLWARAWFGEVLTSLRVFGWTQAFRSRRWPDRPTTVRGGSGLVLVHGFFCNRGVWNGWMARLQEAGVPYIAPTLEPTLASIDDYVVQVEDAVERIEAATGCPPVVVGHSMGGLVARAWWARHGRPGRVRRIVTIGTPHHGTLTARWGHGQNAAQMRRHSGWLRSLASFEAGSPPPLTCFYSHGDNIVFPASTASMPDADNLHLQAVGHVRMVDHPQVWSETLRWRQPSTSTPDRVD